MPHASFLRNHGKTARTPRRPFEKQRLDIEMKLIGVFPRFRPRPRAPGVARVGVCVAVRETPGRAPQSRGGGSLCVPRARCRCCGCGAPLLT